MSQRAGVLGVFIIGLVLMSTVSVVGIVLDDGGDPYRVTALQGQVVEIYGGHGLYRNDSVAKAVVFRGFDWTNLVLCVPPSILGILQYRRGHLRGQLILAGIVQMSAFALTASVFSSLSFLRAKG